MTACTGASGGSRFGRMWNAPLGRGVAYVENSDCAMNLAMGRCYLRALVDIEVGEEILWDYGTAYAFGN